MDKNKAAYKFKNIGPIYYLNLDGQPERKEYMEEQFKYWEIENYTRISTALPYIPFFLVARQDLSNILVRYF